MVRFLKKYRHGLPITIFSILYLIVFFCLEQRNVRSYHVIDTLFDSYIPFCEYFIVPYLLWFPYMIGTVLYFIFKNEHNYECYQLSFNMMMGMTIFVIVSYIYPNMLDLRPTEFVHDNFFTALVASLYRTDTPTNVLPSIHVFNSLAIHMAISHSQRLKPHKGLCRASLLLTILIILSTMFLKQHSLIDVCFGATLALFGNLIFYPQRMPVEGVHRRIMQRILSHSNETTNDYKL